MLCRILRVLTLTMIVVLLASGCSRVQRVFQGGTESVIPTPVLPTVVYATVDATQHYQTIDGFGVNINGTYWNGGAFAPALDALSDELGSTIFRVMIETPQWERVNDDNDPQHFNWSEYDQIYQGPQFTSLWAVIRYLEQKPNAKILLNVMGPLPLWMGDRKLDQENEAEFVEMITSLIVYAHEHEGLSIGLLSPLNEIDLGNPEGPNMPPDQYVRVMHLLSARLSELGYSDVQLAGPELAYLEHANNYLQPLMRDPVAMERFAVVALHDYAGQPADFQSLMANSLYSDRHVWLTEFSQWCDSCNQNASLSEQWTYGADSVEFLLRYLQKGASAALLYDGVDGYYVHHGTFDYWGVLSYNPDNGNFYPRPRFYAAAQVFRFIRSGMVRVNLSANTEGMSLIAFIDPSSGDLTVAGRNATDGSINLDMTISGLAGLPPIMLYQTTASASMQSSPTKQTPTSISTVIGPDSVFVLSSLKP